MIVLNVEMQVWRGQQVSCQGSFPVQSGFIDCKFLLQPAVYDTLQAVFTEVLH